MDTKKCTKCGIENDLEARVCKNCGNFFEDVLKKEEPIEELEVKEEVEVKNEKIDGYFYALLSFIFYTIIPVSIFVAWKIKNFYLVDYSIIILFSIFLGIIFMVHGREVDSKSISLKIMKWFIIITGSIILLTIAIFILYIIITLISIST